MGKRYDNFEEEGIWWSKIIKRIPDDEVWSWIEGLHGYDIEDKIIYDDVSPEKHFSFIDDTHICGVNLSFGEVPDWLTVKAVKYWIREGWELPK